MIRSYVHQTVEIPPKRLEQKNIPRDATVIYTHETIYVIKGKSVIFVYNKIESLHTYNEFDGVTSFYKTGNKMETFRGFG